MDFSRLREIKKKYPKMMVVSDSTFATPFNQRPLELGADIVKVSYTGSVDSFRKVVAGCPVPVVIAGGPKMSSDRDILEMVQGAIEAGGAGVSIGRNVFQHRDPSRMVGAISMLVHENSGVEEALSFLQAV